MSQRASDLAPNISLHQALRNATTTLHEAVERRFAGYDLARADDYGQFLALHAAAIIPLEQALDRAGIAGDLTDWPIRRRTEALTADLAALGMAAAPPGVVPTCGRGAEALGAAYVLEGSRLGAAVLLRLVAPGLPTAFLRHGTGQGLWRSFLVQLALVPTLDAPAAIRGARRAFAQFLAGGRP